MSQLPSLFGVAGGGHNFFDRAIRLAGQARRRQSARIGNWSRGDRALAPGRAISDGQAGGTCRGGVINPLGNLFGLPALGVPVTGNIPAGIAGLRGARLSGCWSSRSYFQSRPDACCWLISRVFRRPGVLLRSMATAWMSGRNFWGWGLPTSLSRLATAIPWPADCRSPPSMTRRERARLWHWCFARLLSHSVCFSLRGC